jgi:LuxR family maltose regulon positive regulatory protein
MNDAKALPTLISSKLNRPTLVENHIHRPHLIAKLDQRLQRPLILVSAPAGYGKTMLVSCWLEANSRPGAWVSLDKDDNDLCLFLSYFLAAIQSCPETGFSDIGRKALAMINAVTLPPVLVLAASLINELDRIEHPFTLVLDDFHHIENESIFLLLDQLLRHPPQALHLVLICRRDPPLAISQMRAKSLLTEIRIQDLRFNKAETATFLTQELGTQVDLEAAAALEEKTEGWVTGLRLAVLSMRHQGRLDARLLEPQADAQYVMEYLFTEVFSEQPPEINQYLINTAILDRFCGPLCEAVFMQGSEPFTGEIGGWEFIAWLKKENLFLIPLDAENRWFRFHHLFQKLLLNQLQRHHSPQDINALHARASTWFAENGLIEEALKHALAGGNSTAAAQLIAKHGFDLLNDAQWSRLKRWLSMLPDDLVDQELELLVLASWVHVIHARHGELVSFLDKAEALCTTRSSMEHAIGHLNVLRAGQHILTVNGERTLTCARRALDMLPRKHRWARMFTFLMQAFAHQVLGDRANALATIKQAMRESDQKSGAAQGYFQANPCFIYWMEADLLSILQTAAQSLKVDENFQAHQATSHGLYFLGIAHYHRNELQAAEENLVSGIKKPYSQHALNFAHSAFALALVHQALGRTDEANKVGESVVSYGLDTNNPDVLKSARAFQAELALRQGRLAEASYWAEQFIAKPFTFMYRFYVPQLTLARVLLAQDTKSSSEQAADLLKQLYDFVVSSHNKRFQIDVQALQALLYDSQGEGQAALEILTNALQLAEPGGFIRPFVDLGSLMADLLKRLHWKRIARDYIEKILAAFEQEGDQTVLPEANGQPTASARQPQRPSPPSQPLVEPLTNRELDILELLAQRLSNKEIAEKLFISAETVKSHLQNIFQKLEVGKRREAVEKAKKVGILGIQTSI